MKKIKQLNKIVLSLIVTTTSAISCGLVLSSCSSNSKDNSQTNSDVVINDESPAENELTAGEGVTLYVNVASSKTLKYQWYVDKGDNNWSKIEGATSSSYGITSSTTEGITQSTIWKYKAEIYPEGEEENKITSKIYVVNIQPENNSNPSPDEPITPPTNPDNPSEPSTPSTSITSSSLHLKNVGQLLPSQYLTSISSATLNTELLTQNFDTTKITNVSYEVSEFDDQKGTLSILMKYTSDGNSSSYTFNFTNLLSLGTSGYNIEFENNSNVINVSAQEIASKTINNNSSFQSFVKELKDSNINFKLKLKGNELPLDYLEVSNLAISNFSTAWFTSNNKLTLSFTLQNAKINYYSKSNSSSAIIKSSFDYPSNLNKNMNIQFYSAADYLLNKITSNTSYSDTKYLDYYYYDITENNSLKAQLKITNGQWLSNVTTELTYNSKKYTYQPLLDTNITPSFYDNGILTIYLKMKYQGDSSSDISSQLSKDINVSGFKEYDENDLFANDSNTSGKFSLSCDSKNYDTNISRLKSRKNQIISEIDRLNTEEIILFDDSTIVQQAIVKTLIQSLTCNFSSSELVKSSNGEYYSNDFTAIQSYHIDDLETYLQYDRSKDVFQLVVGDFSIFAKGINGDGYATYEDSLTINITSPGNSLNKLKAA